MNIHTLSDWRYSHTVWWSLLLCTLIVALAATIGRATINLRSALVAEDATLAVMLLLPEEDISDLTMIRAGVDTQEFLAETKDGPKLIRVKKIDGKWKVQEEVELRESDTSSTVGEM